MYCYRIYKLIPLALLTLVVLSCASDLKITETNEQLFLDRQTNKVRLDKLPTAIGSHESSPYEALNFHYSTALYEISQTPSPNTYWHSFQLTNQDTKPLHYELVAENFIIEHLDFYQFSGDTLISHHPFSLGVNAKTKTLHDAINHLPIQLAPGQSIQILIKKHDDGPLVLPLTLYSKFEFEHRQQWQFAFWGSVICLLLVLCLYNVILYSALHRYAYLWYLGFHVCAFVYFSALHGYGSLIWGRSFQDFIAMHSQSINFILYALGIKFSYIFLDAKRRLPEFYRYSKLFLATIALGFVGTLFLADYHFFWLLLIFHMVVSAYFCAMGFTAYRRKFKPALYYMISWGFTIVGASIGMAAYYNIIEMSFFTEHALLFGVILEFMMFSVALASRYKDLEKRALVKAYIDPQTDIINYVYFEQYFYKQLPEFAKTDDHLALFIIGFDGFRSLSGLVGIEKVTADYKRFLHAVDQYFKDSGKIAGVTLPSGRTGCIAALPNDQILLAGAVSGESHDILALEELVKRVEKKIFTLENISIKVNMTTGYTVVDSKTCGALKAIHLFRQAQTAFNHAKSYNLQCVRYDYQLDDKIKEQMRILSKLRAAIDNSELSIHIQPQVDLHTNKVCSGEVLIRWFSDEGMISPGHFIPIAEQGGLIFDVTKQVIALSCQWLNENDDVLPHDFSLSINLSVLDLKRAKFDQILLRNVEKYGIRTRQILLEITETEALGETIETSRMIRTLKNAGFKIALDDFGTGYSSLAYLQKIEADEVKLDLSFIANIHESKKNQQIVRALINLAKSMDIRVVAEGIEQVEELNWLLSRDCDIAQGYYFFKPMDTQRFRQLLENKKEIELLLNE